jgi:hypothetical protein
MDQIPYSTGLRHCFWERDYGWGVRVRRHFGARGMSSVRYGTRLGDLKNKQSTHTLDQLFLATR